MTELSSLTLLAQHYCGERPAFSELDRLTGIVVKGDQRGRTLGFPTANIAIGSPHELRQGVYAVWVELGGQLLPGVAAYGKPMFDNSDPPLETHIFDFSGDIYGQQISVFLVAFLRESKVFTSVEGLITCMNDDARRAREILAGTGQSRRPDVGPPADRPSFAGRV